MNNVYLVHGWGLNPHAFRALAAQLYNMDLRFVDLGFVEGYHGKTVSEIPGNAIVIGHSLGALWLLRQRQDFRAFISMGGFDCFHAHVDKREIEAMKKHLDRNPAAQMHGFWQACGTRDFAPNGELVVPRLKEGLDWLATWDARKEFASLTCPVLALATEDDRIVKPEVSKAIFKKKDLRWLETGGHAMPLTVPAWCARQIQEFVNELR